MAATRLTRGLCLRHPIETMLEIYKSPPSPFQKWNWWNIHWGRVKSLFARLPPLLGQPSHLVTLPTFHLFNPGLCYFAREEDYIYCNSCSISRAQIPLVVEIFYTPVTIWPSLFGCWCLSGDPSNFPSIQPRTLLFCKRGGLYILQLLFNFQGPNPSGCWDILYACHNLAFTFWLLVHGDPPKFPSIQPRTLLFCKRGGLYILQLLFNFQGPNPFGCWDILYACHNLAFTFWLLAPVWWPSQVSS